MTWWMIVLLIAAVLALIGCIPVGVDASYDDNGLSVRLKVWLFHKSLTLKQSGTAKSKKKKSRSKQDNASEKKKSPLLSGGISGLFSLLQLLLDTLGDLHRKLRVEELTAHLTFGGADPAAAALNYGRAWAVIGNLNAYLERLFFIKKRDICPILDYNKEEKMQLQARLVTTITIGRLLSLAARGGLRFMKLKKELLKGGAVNESPSV